MITDLQEYFAIHGHCNVPSSSEDIKLAKLGHDLSRARGQFERGKLAPETVVALEAMNVSWDPQGQLWENGRSDLEAFKAKNGHCRPSAKSTDEAEQFLYRWCDRQRTDLRDGRITKERKIALDELGFTWNQQEVKWMIQHDNFKALAQAGLHPHVMAPNADGEVRKSAKWFANQLMLQKEGKLSDERAALFDGLKAEYRPRQNKEKDFGDLVEFQNIISHLSIAATDVDDDRIGLRGGLREPITSPGNETGKHQDCRDYRSD